MFVFIDFGVTIKNIFFEDNCEIKEDVVNLISNLVLKQKIRLHTSGTTGKPKEIYKDTEDLLNSKKSDLSEEKWLLTFDPKRWSGVSVISHALKYNCQLYIPKSLGYKDLIDCCFKNKITNLSITPSLFRTILLNDSDNKFKSCSLNQITFGGEVAKQSIIDTTLNIFPKARVTHVYASTETGDICSVSDGLEGIPKYKFDKEYFKFTSQDELIFKTINTQDIWELDSKKNRYYFKGRIQEIINVGGVKVSPHTIEEAAILSGSKMAKAYSIPSPILGNLVCLEYVGDISEKELKESLKKILSRYEMPSKFKKIENMELNSGKLQRRDKDEKSFG